jgi:hypothetical protein
VDHLGEIKQLTKKILEKERKRLKTKKNDLKNKENFHKIN